MDNEDTNCETSDLGVEYVGIAAFRKDIKKYIDLVADGAIICVTFHEKPMGYLVPPHMLEGV